MTPLLNSIRSTPILAALLPAMALLLVLCSNVSLAEETLFLAKYKGKYSGMTIKSSRKLVAKDDGSFAMLSNIENMMASISETSLFTLEDNQLKPSSYHYKRKIMGFKADEKVTFLWDKSVAQYRRKNKPEKNKDHAIALGVLDPALYQFQLQREAQAGEKAFKLVFVKPGKVKTLLFQVTGEETLKVADKDYRALKVERINMDDLKKTVIWLIPEFNYQIGRIEHTEEKGDSYAIHLTDYEYSPKLANTLYSLPSK